MLLYAGFSTSPQRKVFALIHIKILDIRKQHRRCSLRTSRLKTIPDRTLGLVLHAVASTPAADASSGVRNGLSAPD